MRQIASAVVIAPVRRFQAESGRRVGSGDTIARRIAQAIMIIGVSSEEKLS
jgi:hypothetical protein